MLVWTGFNTERWTDWSQGTRNGWIGAQGGQGMGEGDRGSGWIRDGGGGKGVRVDKEWGRGIGGQGG